MIMKNDFNYKWSKLFASKRYNTKDGVIQLTPEEQQELLDDAERAVKNCSIHDVVDSEAELCGKRGCNRPKMDGNVYCLYHYEVNFG